MSPSAAEVRSSTPTPGEEEEAMEPLNTSVSSSGGPLNRSAMSYMLRDASENCCILVVGSTGTGKSATIAKLTGTTSEPLWFQLQNLEKFSSHVARSE